MKMLPHIYIAFTDHKGRGIFTALDIPANSIIEICPLILIPNTQTGLIDQTKMYDYYFVWDDDHIAIALGYGSLYNHSSRPNARVIYDFESNEIQIESISDIHSGDEILIHYHDEISNSELWFEEKE